VSKTLLPLVYTPVPSLICQKPCFPLSTNHCIESLTTQTLPNLINSPNILISQDNLRFLVFNHRLSLPPNPTPAAIRLIPGITYYYLIRYKVQHSSVHRKTHPQCGPKLIQALTNVRPHIHPQTRSSRRPSYHRNATTHTNLIPLQYLLPTLFRPHWTPKPLQFFSRR
jgi:hypothetical protein